MALVEGFTPVTFVKTVDGERKERTAETPEGAVALRFDGWQPKGGDKNAAAIAANEKAVAKSTGEPSRPDASK